MTVLLAAGSIFDPIYNILGGVLAFFYGLIPNLGVAIILLTLSIMVVLYPLTAKQAKSMIAMQKVQPEIKKLQAKYKNDRQKLNEEMMVFYKENKINPLAGCLPMLVQLPIFFALFRVLKDAYKHIPKSSTLYHDLCRGFTTSSGKNYCNSSLTSKIHDALPNLSGFKNGDTLLHHLSFLGIDLQKTATDAHNGLMSALPYFLLVGMVMLTGYLQSLQSQKRTPQANKQLGTVMKVLPVFFGVISLSFPAGLVLYFFVSNLFRLGQQEVIFRNYGSALSPGGTKASTLDVTSRERSKTSTKVLEDAEPEDAEPDGDDEPVASPPAARRLTPAQRQAKSVAQPATNGDPRGMEDGSSVPAAPRGGFRSLFQLPPPPAGGTLPVPPARPARSTRAGTASSGAPRPPQPRSRNKKKRKR